MQSDLREAHAKAYQDYCHKQFQVMWLQHSTRSFFAELTNQIEAGSSFGAKSARFCHGIGRSPRLWAEIGRLGHKGA